MAFPLSPIFAQPVATSAAHLETRPTLERHLQVLWERARAAWPGIRLSKARFFRYLTERLPATHGDQDKGAEMLREAHAADLYLACACAEGEPSALAEFERRYIAHVADFLSRRDTLPGFCDELKQTLRERLLLAQGNLRPRIGSYTGRGSLAVWLRIVATRAAIDLRRQQRSAELPIGSSIEDLPATLRDAELGVLRQRHGPVVRRAFRETLRALSAREATLLRLFYFHNLSSGAISRMYRANERTVRRWLEAIRNRILVETRERLREDATISTTQVTTLLNALRTELRSVIMDAFCAAKYAE